MKAGKPTKRVRAARSTQAVVAGVPLDALHFAVDASKSTESVSAREAMTLSPECTARNAAALKAALLDLVEVSGNVDVEIAAVERVDTVCLQLLSAFVRERAHYGRPTTWRGRSDVFVQAVALLGLGGTLTVRDTA